MRLVMPRAADPENDRWRALNGLVGIETKWRVLLVSLLDLSFYYRLVV